MEKICLALEDDSSFYGYSFGAERSVAGEVVFNTGMVGYPETLTDPSYKGQILVLTYPLIGNYGVPPDVFETKLNKNFESDKIQIAALVVSDYSTNFSHWNAVKSLSAWLKENNVPAVFGVDTRVITKKIREKGVMLGKVVIGEENIDFVDPNKRNLVSEVSIKNPITYSKKTGKTKIVVLDCGIKNSIISGLLNRDATVIRVPWDYDFLNLDFDGVLISNGPGDPKLCRATINNIKAALKEELPVMGICLGNQLLGLAAGGDTYKLKYGHRSQNQPCLEVGTPRCFITNQNHGYAVMEKSLKGKWSPWFTNLNDNTNEGIRHNELPFLSVQFHPEATPGAVDTSFLFDKFLKIVEENKKRAR